MKKSGVKSLVALSFQVSTVSAKKAHGSGKMSGFLHLLQIWEIKHHSVETLQHYALTSGY
jgi:hypothetical protein